MEQDTAHPPMLPAGLFAPWPLPRSPAGRRVDEPHRPACWGMQAAATPPQNHDPTSRPVARPDV